MRSVFVACLAGLALVCTPAVASAAGQGNNGQVCAELDSGKIDTTGDPSTVTITAPAGFAIAEVCVKAGSANQGLGPEYVTPTGTVTTWTLGHSSGKAVSHWSASFVELPVAPGEEPGEEPGDEPGEEPGEEPTEPPVEPAPVEPTEPTEGVEPVVTPAETAPVAPAAAPVSQAPTFAG